MFTNYDQLKDCKTKYVIFSTFKIPHFFSKQTLLDRFSNFFQIGN